MKRIIGAVCGAVIAGSTFAARYEAASMTDALRVRDAIRADRASGKIAADEPVTVVFKPGEYVLDATLALEETDSGSEKAPVTWCAEKPGSARFFGGKRIPLSAFRPVADAATRKRLEASVCDAVRVCDVTPYLVKDAKPWPDKITGVLPGPWLYVDGEPQTVARWPNADAPEKGWFGFTKNIEKGSPTTPGAFEFPGDRAERWDFAKGVWMLGYWRFDWHCEYLKMASYDAKTHVMRTAGFPTWKIGDGKEWPFYKRRIHAVNLLEELDQPGEWHLDVAAKRLYWYPPKDVSERTEIVLAQALGPFVTMNGTKHVVLSGLNFEYSHGGAVVDLKGTTDCRVQDCTIANHAGLAIGVLGTHNRITRTTIRNIGARAIHLQGGNERALLPANNLVDGTVIEGYAMFQRTMAAGMLIEGCGQAVRDCVFRNAPYIAIGYHGNEHLIADCEFDHVVQEAGDSGCIYSGHNASNLGTIIFGNHIHDLAKTAAECSGRSGIYFDDCDWGDDVIGNTLENVGLGILIGGGKLHGVYNNLFKGGKRGVHVDGRGVNWRWRGAFCWWSDGKSFCQYRHRERNIDPDEAPWAVAYPQLSRAMYDRPQYPLLNVVEGNRFAGCAKPFECGDRDARRSLGERLDPSNVVTTNAPTGDLVAPQPIRLKDAARNVLVSADGSVTAVVSLDVSAHLSWTLSDGARRILARSPLGVTVDDFDFGRRVVPGAAQSLGEVPLKAFTNGTHIVKGGNGDTVKPAVTNMPAFASLTARAWRIPLRSLITGKDVASLEVRLWPKGAAFRWTVPGEGRHFIRGENSAFVPGGDKAVFKFIEWERDADYENGYAEACPYPRAKSVTGLVFPNAPRGWEHTGEVITPWRGLVW